MKYFLFIVKIIPCVGSLLLIEVKVKVVICRNKYKLRFDFLSYDGHLKGDFHSALWRAKA